MRVQHEILKEQLSLKMNSVIGYSPSYHSNPYDVQVSLYVESVKLQKGQKLLEKSHNSSPYESSTIFQSILKSYYNL